MKIKILETGVISKTKGENLNVIDVEIIEGNTFLPNKKYKSEDGKMKFTLISIGHYSPSITKKYPCVIDIDNGVDLKTFKDKIFIME